MTRTQHGHTPYPVILHHYLNMWRKDHEGTIPTKYSDKKLFKSDMTKGVLMRENNPEVPEVTKTLNCMIGFLSNDLVQHD